MTDVRQGRGTSGRDGWIEPGQDLDDVLARWGSEQTGPFRRPAGGRHAGAEPSFTDGDDPLGLDVRRDYSAPPVSSSDRVYDPGHPRAASPAAERSAWPSRAGTPAGTPAPLPEHPSGVEWQRPSGSRAERSPGGPAPLAEHPSGVEWQRPSRPEGEPVRPRGAEGGRRYRPDHVPPLWTAAAGAAPAAAPSAAGPPTFPPPGPPRLDDTAAYAGWLAGAAGPGRPDGRKHAAGPGPRPAGPAAPGAYGTVGPGSRTAGPAAHATGPEAYATGSGPHAVGPGAYGTGPGGPAAGRGGAAHGVGVLERTADPYGDPYGDPYAPDGDGPDDDDGTPGRHRRTGARPARRRRPRWLRTVRGVAMALAVLLVLGGGFGLYQYRKLSGNINRIDALAPGDAAIRDAAKQLDAENYLLIGSDTRSGANGVYEEAAGQVSGERSDTTILAHLSPGRDKATLVSFPRDSWVTLPACKDRAGRTVPERDGQFNEAFATGGPSCTVLAVQKLTGIKINHYVQVDFTGFKTMVDAVGGVPICTTTPLRDAESGLRMDRGTTVLKGEQALAYVRARYGIGDGSDLGRIERQQKFLGAMVRAATSTKLLVNPVALTKFLGAATKSLTLDKQTSFGDLKALADQLNGLDPKKVTFVTAPIADPAYNPPGFPALRPGQGGSKVLLDAAAGRTLWDSIINDRPAAPAGSSPAPKPKNVLTVAPGEVTVRVLNGVGTSGLATTVGDDLTGVGFSTVTPSNAPRTTVTTVRYAPDQAEEAKTLAAAVPGAVLQPDAGTTLDLVVGANYTGVRTVKPGDPSTAKAAAAPKPKPAATTAKPPVTAADTTCT